MNDLLILKRIESDAKKLIQQAIDKAVKELKDIDIFRNLEPLKGIARSEARDEIADFKQETNDQVKTILQELKDNKKEILNKTEKALTEAYNEFISEKQKMLSEVSDGNAKVKSDIQSKFTDLHNLFSSEHQRIIKNIESMRGPQGIQGEQGLKGDKGDKGDDGKDGKDLDKTEIIRELQKYIRQNMPRVSKPSGGGMGNIQTKTFTGDGSTTTFQLTYHPAQGGNAIMMILYNSQPIEKTTHYSCSTTGLITTTFTPANGLVLYVVYIR